ncbi:hypothetical protein D9M72_370250 [compost metagenome]
MQQAEHGLARMRQLAGAVAQHLRASRGKIQLAAAEMPVPQAVVAAFHRQLQLLLALGQRLAQPPFAPQRAVRQQDRHHQQQGRHHRAAGGQQPRHPARRLPKVF